MGGRPPLDDDGDDAYRSENVRLRRLVNKKLYEGAAMTAKTSNDRSSILVNIMTEDDGDTLNWRDKSHLNSHWFDRLDPCNLVR